MAMTMKILMFLMSIIQFLFPFIEFDTPEIPEEETTAIVEETTTQEQPTFDGCRHTGGVATCSTLAVCELCGESYGTTSLHKYSQTITPASCTEDGYTVFTCMYCSYIYIDNEKPATGHNYKSRVIAPTCEYEGRTAFVCENCNDTYGEDIVPALGHSYEMTEQLPDCVNAGKYIYTCSRCFDSYEEATDVPLGHNYIGIETKPTCTNRGYTTYTCPGCENSYIDDIKEASGHRFENYVPDGNATCSKDGTKTAYCENGCNNTSTLEDVGSMLPHTDNNKDKYCDNGGEELFMEFTHLTYPSEAVKTIDSWGRSLEEFTARADKTDEDIYTANCGYQDTSGIIISPFYTTKIDGVSVPVYGALTYIGTSGKGAIHSFSEIYVEKGEYCTFRIEITSASLGITDAKVIPESFGEKVTVSGGKVTAILSGYGAHTFMFNGDNQSYAYTVFVREEIDEDAEIAKLREDGYEVYEVAGYMPFDYVVFSGTEVSNKVIYLRKGAYVMANHKFEIKSDADNQNKSEATDAGAQAIDHNGIGLNRFPFISAHNTKNIKVLGYGALDLSHLDRGERRGMVFTYSKNIEVRGVKLINSPEWSFITYRCENVDVKNVDIFGYRTNSDAFDICNSKIVTVDGCFARTGDDLFAAKALNGDANAVSDTITFTNCYAWAAKARAFGLFGESNRSVNNITFRDCYVLMHDATWDKDRIPAIGIVVETVNPDNGATKFSNITFENIEIYRNDAAAMNCLIYNGVTNFTIENVQFRNIIYSSNNVLNRVVDYGGEGSGNSIQTTFENVTCNGTKVVDSNKTQYFSEESYHGNYITIK